MIANYPKAYTEILEVLKYLTIESVSKIPQEVLETFEQFKDNNYKFEIRENDDLTKLKLMDETKAILVNMYRDYWSTKKERERITNIQQELIKKIELEKHHKYNPENIFKNKKSY